MNVSSEYSVYSSDVSLESSNFYVSKIFTNTPGTAGGPGGRDRTLAVKSRKTAENHSFFFVKKLILPNIFFCIYLLVTPKYLERNNFAHGRFPKVDQKQKTEGEKKEEREREKERLNDGNNNGQATHGARKPAWRTQAAWAKITFINVTPIIWAIEGY